MVWTIAKKEFHDNLLTFRFSFGSLILILLVLAITLASIKNYKDLNQEYMFSVNEAERMLKENRVYSTIRFNAIKPPEILSILNLGVTNRLGNSVLISRREVPYPAKKYREENPLLNIFSSLDLTLVYSIVISLLAMLFAFDAISGEKEKGTLRLLLSQRVSRFKIILGKYFGNMLTLAMSFLISLFIGFIVLIAYFPNLSRDNWLRTFFFALFTLLYISIFFTLGLILSSLTNKASHTFVFCIFLWMVFVIIVPNLTTYLAVEIKPILPEKSINAKIDEIDRQTEAKMRTWWKENPFPFSGSGIYIDEGSGYFQFMAASEETINGFRKLFSFSEPIYKERAEKIWGVKQDYYFLLKGQEKLAAILNRMSPAGLYQEATEVIAETSISNYERFIQQTVMYRESIFNYLESKDALHSLRFFTVMEEKDLIPGKDFWKVYGNKKKPDGSSYTIKDFSPLDLSDFPRFRYQEERLSDIFAKVMHFLIIFIVINLLFFIGSAVAFNFYDVR
jgi:ABC-type transport system involved in multi-copper enzyme maturation permease subunit